MSAAEVGIGGPPAPRWGVAARLQARLLAMTARLRDAVARLLDPDENTLAAWAAAFARAPQAVPNLPLPQNKRLARFVISGVVGAHVALLLLLYWRSSPPPPPRGEMTVELVREMPEPPKPKPEAKEAPKPVPLQPGDDKAKAEGRKSNPASQQGQPDAKKKADDTPKPQKAEEKPKAEEKKAEEKPKAERPKPQEKPKPAEKPEPRPKAERQPAHQHQARRAPQQQQQQAQAQPKPAPEQPSPEASQTHRDNEMAMPAVALPGASDSGTDAVSYSQLVLSQVAKAKKQGRYMGVPGYAGVRFSVADDGSLASVKLVMSSGDPNLDIEAEAMVRRAAPFPKPPPGGRRDYGITLVFAAQPQ